MRQRRKRAADRLQAGLEPRQAEANLPPVRMSAQHEVKPGVGGLPVDFWSVREQDGDTTAWNVCGQLFRCCLRGRNARPPPPRDRFEAGPERMATDSLSSMRIPRRFEVWNHGNRIVVTKHSIDVAAKRFTQARYDLEA